MSELLSINAPLKLDADGYSQVIGCANNRFLSVQVIGDDGYSFNSFGILDDTQAELSHSNYTIVADSETDELDFTTNDPPRLLNVLKYTKIRLYFSNTNLSAQLYAKGLSG